MPEITLFTSGVHNILPSEEIPNSAASDSANFLTKDGRIVLRGGRTTLGALGSLGGSTGFHKAYTVAGTTILYVKWGTTIKYWDGTNFTNVITGLTSSANYTMVNYRSLTGSYVLVAGVDGLWKINTANPATSLSLYNGARNFKGHIFVDKARCLLWNTPTDKTGLYGSYIDGDNLQDVAGEVLGASGSTAYSGTLAFKGQASSGITFTVDATTDLFTSGSAHGYKSGELVRVTTSGTLPAGMSAGTTYYVLVVTSTTYYLYTDASLTLRLNVTSTGSGTNTAFLYGAMRDCSAVSITATTGSGQETFTDNLQGVLTSNLGGTGTINYITGAYAVTFSAVTTSNVTAEYQWQDSTDEGILDFTYSATRLAGEGFVVRQDEGGDPILNVLIGQDGAYYSLKEQSAYRLTIDTDDTSITNHVYRKELGLPFFRACFSSNIGIVFINTSNPSKPQMTILQKNTLDNVEPKVIFPQFDFSLYNYDTASMCTFDRYFLLFCKTPDAENNDTILACNIDGKTVDILKTQGNEGIQEGEILYVSDSVTQSVFELFSGFDDLGLSVEAYCNSKSFTFGANTLKKLRKLRLKGNISPDQWAKVYMNLDSQGFEWIGSIRGSQSYVLYNDSLTIGSKIIGEIIGGDDDSQSYEYFLELKLSTPKFRTMSIRIEPQAIGYFDLNYTNFFDLLVFEDRMPKFARLKQRVSLSGLNTNQ